MKGNCDTMVWFNDLNDNNSNTAWQHGNFFTTSSEAMKKEKKSPCVWQCLTRPFEYIGLLRWRDVGKRGWGRGESLWPRSVFMVWEEEEGTKELTSGSSGQDCSMHYEWHTDPARTSSPLLSLLHWLMDPTLLPACLPACLPAFLPFLLEFRAARKTEKKQSRK